MPKKRAKDSKELFAKYIQKKTVAIIDPAIAVRAGIAKAIIDLGAKPNNVKLSTDFDSAKEMIAEVKPDVVICEYDLGPHCGLDLLQDQRQANPDSQKSVFILVTHDSSQSTVAQAAEEDIDNYVLKPYALDTLAKAVIQAALAKEYPSKYHLKIEEGKKVLFDGDPETAIDLFEEAMEMDAKPTLACFYHGQAHLFKKMLDSATDSYNDGLAYNNIHYKCITGLFDVLMTKKMYPDAYEVIKRISRYFPANPKRLSTVLRLAVQTNNYEDIERYYQTFTQIDVRNEELMRYICAALVTCGKFYLRTQAKTRALALFEKTSIYAAERPHILREIIVSLWSSNMQDEAATFLKRFSEKVFTSPEFLAMKYIILDDRTLPPAESIAEAEKLIEQGIKDPEVYRAVIIRCTRDKQPDKAQEFANTAAELWPKQKDDFQEIATPNEKPGKQNAG